MAVSGAAHRVLRHPHLWGKRAGDAVVPLHPRRRDLHQGPLHLQQLVHVRLQRQHVLRPVKDAQQVPGPPDLRRPRPQALGDLLRPLQPLQLVGGEIHAQQLSLRPHGQQSAEGLEADPLHSRLHESGDDMGRGQGGVAA